MIKKIPLISSLFLLFTPSVLAADLPADPVSEPTSYDRFDTSYNAPDLWTGPYMGLLIGTIKGKSELEQFSQKINDKDLEGYSLGISFGYNHMISKNWLVGFELDASKTYLDGKGSSTPTVQGIPLSIDAKDEIKWSSHTRLKAGRLFSPAILVFGSAGLATALVKNEASISSPLAPVTVGSDENLRFGWSIGGGVESKITNNVNLRAEYLFDRFDGDTGSLKTNNTIDNHTVRAGLTFRLN